MCKKCRRAISSQMGGGSKNFEDWGGGSLKDFRTERGYHLGGVTFAGEINTPLHAMN